MKRFKAVSAAVFITILILGLIPCVISYADHELNCTGCSAHGSHPAIELMIYGLVVLFAGALFGLSRLILRLLGGKLKDKGEGAKPKKTDMLILIILACGLVHYAAMIIWQSLSIFGLDFLSAAASLTCMLPYIWAAAMIFLLRRYIKWRKISREKISGSEKAELNRAKWEKISYMTLALFMSAGLLYYSYAVFKCLSDSYQSSPMNTIMLEGINMIPFALTGGFVFCIIRLIMPSGFNKSRFDKGADISAAVILAAGLLHSLCMFIACFFGSKLDFLTSSMQFCMIPYAFAAGVIFGVSRLLRRQRIKNSKEAETAAGL